MTDLEVVPESIPDRDAPALTGAMPRSGTALGETIRQLWHAAQRPDDPDVPWVRAATITAATGLPAAAVSANLAQLRYRGLVRKVQRSKTGASGRGTPTWYALTDAGAVACAAVFGPGGEG